MGAIARSAANNITTSGVFTSSAITNSSVTGITVLANASDGITFISSQTASSSSSISFTTGINSTYKAYKFVFVNIRPATDNSDFLFQGSTDGGSNYGIAITSTHFSTYHDEADTGTNLSYSTAGDLAQSTAFQDLSQDTGSGADESGSGSLLIFNPSSTTYVKHFINNMNDYNSNDYSTEHFTAGYFNTTSAINAFRFQMSSGNIADGKIYLYGIK
jgi:hypothetical protein